MSIEILIAVTAAAYLFGSIPFGLIYSKMRGVDIRKVGSGNIGATNVGRQFGFWGGFVPIFILDCLKGAIPVLIVRLIGTVAADLDLSMMIVGMASILGHLFPVYVKFKGGKGVATAAGVFLVIAPIPCAIAIGVFLLLYLITKVVAIGSIVAAIALPITIVILEPHRTVVMVVTIAAALLIIVMHRSNIAKLISGKKDGDKSAEKTEEKKE
ncbi:MAG: acyl-phosphate glycerol 3-phosphate acyltransferase [Spirochaetes bacterium GWF1_51_8]|nr:MAG: acyl-phosphate glycerol 3-phosphate acyltransferase [Spirochaetes bacterium GWF1_51_8]